MSTSTRTPAARRTRLRLAPAATAFAAASLAGALLAAPSASAATARATAPAAAPAGAAARPAAATLATTLPGQDVSWPQCPTSFPGKGYGLPMPSSNARFVVIGVSGGRGFTRNPCLGYQVAWARAHHMLGAVYTVPSYPSAAELKAYGARGPYGTRTLLARLKNVGWSQARATLQAVHAHRMTAPTIWVDVEPVRSRPWSSSTTRNNAVLRGMIDGFRISHHNPGIYSNRSGWASITGNARYGVPEWRTVGQTGRARALATCNATSLQGGPIAMVQYWTSTADYDVACPRVATSPARMRLNFHRY